MSDDLLRRFVEAFAPLADRDACSPFPSAWELDAFRMDIDGVGIYDALMAVYTDAKREITAQK